MTDMLTSWNIFWRDLAPVSEHKIADVTLPTAIQATQNHWNVEEVAESKNFIEINKVAKKTEMIWLNLPPKGMDIIFTEDSFVYRFSSNMIPFFPFRVWKKCTAG